MRTQSGRSAWSGWGTSVFRCPGFSADVVDGLVVHHEGAVGVLEGGVGREDRVVRLDHSSGHSEGRLKSSEPSSEEFDRNICSY